MCYKPIIYENETISTQTMLSYIRIMPFCHVSPTMYRNWQQEFQMSVSWLKHLYRDVL